METEAPLSLWTLRARKLISAALYEFIWSFPYSCISSLENTLEVRMKPSGQVVLSTSRQKDGVSPESIRRVFSAKLLKVVRVRSGLIVDGKRWRSFASSSVSLRDVTPGVPWWEHRTHQLASTVAELRCLYELIRGTPEERVQATFGALCSSLIGRPVDPFIQAQRELYGQRRRAIKESMLKKGYFPSEFVTKEALKELDAEFALALEGIDPRDLERV